jgi:hypothetical protein
MLRAICVADEPMSEEEAVTLSRNVFREMRRYRSEESGVMLQLMEKRTGESRYGWISFQLDAAHMTCLSDLSGVIIEPDWIDWITIKRWLERCEHNHSCKPYQAINELLPEFRVIDTTSRRIISAPVGCKYAALSYVWGTETNVAMQFQSTLRYPAPLTIEDAITCTRALGLIYLWVDRYCIDQDAPETKHTMIQNMDKIYMDATITLIDAMGSNSHSGLAGVSRTLRTVPRPIEIHGRRLSMVPNIRSAISKSKWASRGWTYQEGLLACRRLVFTRSQVYFQCQEMHCCESLTIAFQSSMLWLEDNLATHFQAFLFQGKYISEATMFNDRLKEYLARDLTFESDALDAFAGVLRQVWNSPSPTYHFWGLPFQSSKFLVSLLWIPEYDLSKKKISRRDNFPSWTWAGWKGITDLRPTSCIWPDHRFDVTINFENTSGYCVYPEEYASSMNKNGDMYRLKPSLHITGWTTSVRLRPRAQIGNEQVVVSDVYDCTGETLLTSASVILPDVLDRSTSEMDLLLGSLWLALFFVRRDGGVTGIILKQIDKDSYERIGVLDRAFFEPMNKVNEATARLRKRDWNPSVWLECLRRQLILV